MHQCIEIVATKFKFRAGYSERKAKFQLRHWARLLNNVHYRTQVQRFVPGTEANGLNKPKSEFWVYSCKIFSVSTYWLSRQQQQQQQQHLFKPQRKESDALVMSLISKVLAACNNHNG